MARKKSEFLRSLGIMFEIWKVLVNEIFDLGGSDDDIRRIETDVVLRKDIAALVVSKKAGHKLVEPVRRPHPSDEVADRYGYRVEEDVEPRQFKVSELESVSFMEESKAYIAGKTMRQRAVELESNPGLMDGMFILKHQDEIPAEMREKGIVLPGTLLRSTGGDLAIAYLGWDWHSGSWHLNFHWLSSGDWNDRCRFVRWK